MKHRPLARSHRRVLWAILEAAQDGRQVSHREIMIAVGWKSTNQVASVLDGLERRGLISRQGFAARTIRPLVRLEFTAEAWPGVAS